MTESEAKLKLDNRVYDIIKYIALIVLPALATLYSTLAGVWGLPYAEQIPVTIMAVDTFMGILLKLSTDEYNREL